MSIVKNWLGVIDFIKNKIDDKVIM